MTPTVTGELSAVYTRPTFHEPWVWMATFADETLANCYIDLVSESSDWDYEIRPA